MSVAQRQLRDEVDRAINKLVAKDASWSRILAKRLYRALVAARKEAGE